MNYQEIVSGSEPQIKKALARIEKNSTALNPRFVQRSPSTPIPLATNTMIAGDFWHCPTGSPPDSEFRVYGLEKVKPKAGTCKLSFVSDHARTVVINDYWFFSRVGIVLEKTSSIVADSFTSDQPLNWWIGKSPSNL